MFDDGGSALSISAVSETDGNGETASISGTTNAIFTPTVNFPGSATINYTIKDDMGNTSNSVINVTITNNPPLAVADSYSVAVNSINNVFNPLTNDVVETPGGTLGLVGVGESDGNGTVAQSG